ncbi:MAG: VTT domain-containing protein [bacterium]
MQLPPGWDHWGLALAFVGPLIGSLGVPVQTVILLAPLGVAYAEGEISLWAICAAFVVGQTIGDCVAYSATSWLGPRINRVMPRLGSYREHPAIVYLFNQHPARGLILAAGLSYLRPIVNYLAPILGIPFGPFLLWSFVRNAIWSTGYVVVVMTGVDLFMERPALRPVLLGLMVVIGGVVWWWKHREPPAPTT